MPSRRTPAFLGKAKAVIFLVDDLVAGSEAWQRTVVPRRLIASVNRSTSNARFSLKACGSADIFHLFEEVHILSAEATEILMSHADYAERSWAESLITEDCIQGFSELLTYLQNTDVEIAFASAMSEEATRTALHRTIENCNDVNVFGRNMPALRDKVLVAAVECATASAGKSPESTLLIGTSRQHLLSASLGNFNRLTIESDNSIDVSDGGVQMIDLALQCEWEPTSASALSEAYHVRQRVRILREKGSLRSEEMAEYGNLTGGFKIVGNTQMFGFADQKTGFDNAMILRAVRDAAAHQMHVLEVLGADAALIEIELRNWLIVHRQPSFDVDDRKTLGQIIQDCRGAGFEEALVERLSTFNRLRNEAVHKLARGSRSYFDIADKYMDDPALLEAVADHVLAIAPSIGRTR